MSAAESGRVATRDVELYYEARGSGPPLILVPGLGAHMMYMASLAP